MKAIVLLKLMSGNNLLDYTHRKHSMEAVNSSATERKKIKKSLFFCITTESQETFKI